MNDVFSQEKNYNVNMPHKQKIYFIVKNRHSFIFFLYRYKERGTIAIELYVVKIDEKFTNFMKYTIFITGLNLN